MMAMRRTHEKDSQVWSWKRVYLYRILGALFLLLGAAPLLIVLKHSSPWWAYILSLSFLIPGAVIVTFSEGIDIDARISAVVRWWKMLGFRRERRRQFSEFHGVYLDEHISKSSSAGGVVFEVWLQGHASALKVYTSSKEDEVGEELEAITALMGLPRIQPPSRQISARKMIIIVVVAFLSVLLLLGLLLLLRTGG
jgi:hypothetical protein